MNHNHLKRILALFLFFDVLLLGAYGFFCYTTFSTAAKVTDLYLTLHRSAFDEAKVHELSQSVDATASDRIALDSFFIKSSNAVTFLEKIEGVAKQSGVDIRTTSFSVNAPAATLDHVFIVDGQFSNIYNFLALIESMPFQILVKNVIITKNSKEEISGSGTPLSPWSATFTISLISYLP